MMDTNIPDPDLSPSLGGARARHEEPAAPPPPGPDAPGASEPPDGEIDLGALRDELASLLGPESAEVLETLTQISTLGMGLGSVLTGALQAFESQLPQALAAFGGLFDAVEQAVEQALDPAADSDQRS